MIDVLKIAIQEIGVTEISGAESNPRIDEYLASSGKSPDDEIPWCSAFVNWCIEQAGYKGTNSALARSWLNWGVHLSSPQLGCIVVIKRGIHPWQGHVGFFLNQLGGRLYLLSGNQNNRVCVQDYETSRLLGYRSIL